MLVSSGEWMVSMLMSCSTAEIHLTNSLGGYTMENSWCLRILMSITISITKSWAHLRMLPHQEKDKTCCHSHINWSLGPTRVSGIETQPKSKSSMGRMWACLSRFTETRWHITWFGMFFSSLQFTTYLAWNLLNTTRSGVFMPGWGCRSCHTLSTTASRESRMRMASMSQSTSTIRGTTFLLPSSIEFRGTLTIICKCTDQCSGHDDSPYHTFPFYSAFFLTTNPAIWFYIMDPRVDALNKFI